MISVGLLPDEFLLFEKSMLIPRVYVAGLGRNSNIQPRLETPRMALQYGQEYISTLNLNAFFEISSVLMLLPSTSLLQYGQTDIISTFRKKIIMLFKLLALKVVKYWSNLLLFKINLYI